MLCTRIAKLNCASKWRVLSLDKNFHFNRFHWNGNVYPDGGRVTWMHRWFSRFVYTKLVINFCFSISNDIGQSKYEIRAQPIPNCKSNKLWRFWKPGSHWITYSNYSKIKWVEYFLFSSWSFSAFRVRGNLEIGISLSVHPLSHPNLYCFLGFWGQSFILCMSQTPWVTPDMVVWGTPYPLAPCGRRDW